MVRDLKRKKVKKKQLIIFGMIVLVGIGVFYLSKKGIQKIVWNNSETTEGNDILYNVMSLQYLFTSSGIIAMLKSIVCKYFYIVASTYGLVFLGIVYMCRIILKHDSDIITRVIFLYSILNFVFIFMINSFKMMYAGRVDCILYGRYFEPCIGMILCFGIHSLMSDYEDTMKKKYCYMILSLLCSFFIAHDMISAYGNNMAVYICISGVGKYFMNGADLQIVALQIVLEAVLYITVTIAIFGICCKIRLNKIDMQKTAILVFCILIAYAWVTDARRVIDHMLLQEEQRYENIKPIANCLYDCGVTFNDRETVYYLRNKDEAWNEYLLSLQLTIGRNRLIDVEYEDWDSILGKKPSFIVMDNGYESNDIDTMTNFQGSYVPVSATKEFILYRLSL